MKKSSSDQLSFLNNEINTSILSIKEKKEVLQYEIETETKERSILVGEYHKIKEELDLVVSKIEASKKNKNELERIVSNTQNAYEKIIENTKNLYNVLKKDEKVLNLKREEYPSLI